MTLTDSELDAHLKKEKAALWSIGSLGDPYAMILRGLDDPYPYYERMRKTGPLYKSRMGNWATGDHKVGSDMMRDRRMGIRFTDGRRISEQIPQFDNSFFGMDPPDHTRLRRLSAPAFHPRQLAVFAEEVEKMCNELIDAIDPQAEFDLMESLARQVPQRVIASLFGISEEQRSLFQYYCEGLSLALDGNYNLAEAKRLQEAMDGLDEMFDKIIRERERKPGKDVISLMQAGVEGADLTSQEAVRICAMMSLAGSETTVNLIGSGILAMIETPGQWEMLRADPTLAPQAVEEALRYDTPVQLQMRVTHEDLEYAGQELPANSVVAILTGAVNRDPVAFPDPDVFDMHRDNGAGHLSFSGGPHYCLGASLARLEGEIAFRVTSQRLPHLRRTSTPLTRRRSAVIRGLKTLPVTAA